MKPRVSLLLIIVGSLLLDQYQHHSLAAERGPNVFTARKGVALPTLVTVAGEEAQIGPGVQYIPKSDFCSDELAAKLRGAGVELTRVVVNPFPLMNRTSEQRATAIDAITSCSDRLVKYGLATMIDVHFWSPNLSANKLTTLTDEHNWNTYIGGVSELARELAKRPQDSVALEPFNEPPCNIEGAKNDWYSLQRGLIARIREIAPVLPVIVTGCSASIDGFKKIFEPAFVADEKVIFTFHFYEPFIFTHQFVWGGASIKNLHYPAAHSGREEATRVALDAAAAAGMASSLRRQISKEIVRYIQSSYDRNDIDRRFEEVGELVRQYRVSSRRVFVGEFGAAIGMKSGDCSAECRASELRWIRDTRSAAEHQGFAFSYWTFPGRNTYAFDDRTSFFKPLYGDALGLQPQ